MGAIDNIIHLVLYGCFGLYIAMGLSLIGLGSYYMYDAGAVGSTASYLIGLGLLMLIIGAAAVFANLKKMWIILLVVECVNVAVFLGLYLLTVIVLLQASGTTDPVRRATEKNWAEILPTLLLRGSDGEDTIPSGAFCETQVTEPAYAATCGGLNGWYKQMDSAPYNTEPCHIGYDVPNYKTPAEVTNNCTLLQEGWTVSGASNKAGCSQLYSACTQCVIGCKEQSITNVKENLVPATWGTLFTAAFLAGTVVWNNIMMAGDEISATQKLPGLVSNGIVAGAAGIMFLVAAWGAYQASDACPDLADDCLPVSIVVSLIAGMVTMAIAGLALFGIKTGNMLMLQIATASMALATVALILVACVLGVSSGTMMEDTGYYYDANYPKLRKAVETANPDYCMMSDTDCKDLTLNDAAIKPKDEDGVAIEEAEAMTRASVWTQQHSALSFLAQQVVELQQNPWLSPCETSGICIFCNTFYERSGFITTSVGTIANYTKMLSGGDEFTMLQIATATEGKNVLSKLAAEDNSPMAADDWTADIENYTMHDAQAKNTMGLCELELIAYAEDDERCNELLENDNNLSPVPLSDPAILKIDSYQRNCRSCGNNIDFPFMFNLPNPWADTIGTQQTECLNFFAGHMINECGFGTGSAGYDHSTCQDQVYGGGNSAVPVGTAGLNVDYVIAKSKKFVMPDLSERILPFCSYSDQGCKAKIKNTIESSMETIGYFGIVFLVFFLGIIYFTWYAIKVYRGESDGLLAGGDDDDGAEE